MAKDIECRDNAKKFREYWLLAKDSEVAGYQKYWILLLGDVLGLEDALSRISFQIPVPTGRTTKFLDAWIPETKVLIEHKKRGVKLDQSQSGHDGMTPYEQALEYDNARGYEDKARWIVTCNFDEIWIYDRSRPLDDPQKITLSELPKELHRLAFLVKRDVQKVDSKELEISVQAGRIVGKLYDALLKQYGSESPETLAALNRLCVRLVFCLYAEDADIFPKNAFRNLVKATPVEFLRRQLLRLFQTLDTPPDKRDRFLEAELAVFPYTNGGLFRGASESEIPPLTEEIVKLLDGSSGFDWSGISPTIFGALFESTLNPATRRAGGMVYTSIENIHKVIDPLFLDDLEKRLDDILGYGFNRVDGRESDFNAEAQRRRDAQSGEIGISGAMPQTPVIDSKKQNISQPESSLRTSAPLRLCVKNTPASLCVNKKQRTALLALQAEIAALKFLDPACGSGNFLTETYLSLRRLENRIIAALQAGQGELDFGTSVKVSISQFHGIEINDFAVTVAKTALWIAEAQMLKETAEILHREPDYLPLKEYDGIVHGNALRMEWGSLLNVANVQMLPITNTNSQLGNVEPGTENWKLENGTGNTTTLATFSYIMGNPPFVGARNKSSGQAADMEAVFGKSWKGLGNLDYVTCWYKKAADFILAAKNAKTTKVAFVSTNSICQGESVALLWKPLFEKGLEIDFAWRSFRWDNEAQAKAHVHCVIVGFSVEGDFNAESQSRRDTQSCFDRINKIDRILDDGNPDNPVNPVKKDYQHKTICGDECGFVDCNGGEKLTQSSQSPQSRGVETSRTSRELKIYDGDKVIEAENINGYLMDAPNAWIESRKSPICDVPEINYGSFALDDGNYTIDEDEYKILAANDPHIDTFLRPFIGAQEFLHDKKRYCVWLSGISPSLIKTNKVIYEKVCRVKEWRSKSSRKNTVELSKTPTLFAEIRQPKTEYLAIPTVCSERREYIPIGMMDSTTIASNQLYVIPSATLYHFGVLTSSVHMAWMRTVCGRLETRYRYSANIVYNNFPWPEVENVANVQMLPIAKSNCQLGNGELGTENWELKNGTGNIGNTGNIKESPNLLISKTPSNESNKTSLRSSASLRLCVKNTPTSLCVKNITQTAQSILDARALYPDSSLADLYDPLTMPPELRKAHAANDAAVMKAYGYASTMTEPEIVAHLFKLYAAKVACR